MDTRPASLGLADDSKTRWLGLEIKRWQVLSIDEAVVEFVARYKVDGKAWRLHETSRFFMIDGRWYYRDGEIRP